MKDRIKKIRSEYQLTQQAFSEKLNISRNNVAGYEAGTRIPSDAVISLICREFNVNEAWLRTGEGAVFVEKTKDQLIEEMVNEIMTSKPEDFRRRFVRALAALDMDGWAALEKFIDSIVEVKNETPPAVAPPTGSDALTPDEQELLRQYREKKNPEGRSSVSNAG